MTDREKPRRGRPHGALPIAAALIDANGYPATYVLAGSFSLLAAVLILFLRQPTAVPAMRPALAGETSKT